ncbi:MAG: hypothetical protein Q9171_005551 [Xanthocarpia ochracea]
MGLPILIHAKDARLISFLPESVLLWLDPRGHAFKKFRKLATDNISQAKRDKEKNITTGLSGDDRGSLFHYIVSSSSMPVSEQSTERLAKEAQVLLGAGTASTARTLDVTVYYILANQHVRNRIMEELAAPMSNFPDVFPSLATLRSSPYLQAVIKEGLRYVSDVCASGAGLHRVDLGLLMG